MNPAIFIDEHCVLSFEIANAKWRPERNKSINQWARPENCASNPSGVDVGLSTEWWKRPIKCPTPPTCCHLATVASSRHCRKQRKIPNFADYYTHKTRRRSVASPPVFFFKFRRRKSARTNTNPSPFQTDEPLTIRRIPIHGQSCQSAA